jgi:Flp pilus assembly protein TadG
MVRHRHPRQSRSGNTVVEFALCFTLLWAVLAGTFQFGYTMYLYSNLNHAVAMGARYASRTGFDSPGHRFVDGVKNVVVFGSPTAGGAPLVPGLSTSQVNVTWTLDAAGVPQTITVAIQEFPVQAIFTTFHFREKPKATVRYAGTYKT